MGEEKQTIIETSSVLYGEIQYEQIYDTQRKTSYYQGYNPEKQTLILMDYIEDGTNKYIPINDKLLQDQCVILPSKAIEYESIQTLEVEIDQFIKTWLEISDAHRQKAVWYIMLTWVYDRLNTLPYLRALGDTGCGKTRYLDVIGGLCYKPMFVGGSVKAAPIFRIIDRWNGTAILDEFNLDKSGENEEIIQILNCGYQRGKPVLRCNKEANQEVESYKVFGPKIMSTRKRFYDQALESRCITEIMQQTTRKDIPVDFTTEYLEKQKTLQNKLLMYRLKNLNQIDPDKSITIDFGQIQPRIRQSFYPFTVLFQHNKELLNKFITQVQQYNGQIVEENSQSFDGQILEHYNQLLQQCEPTITCSLIRESMLNDGWKDETIKTATIGRHLSALGFKNTPKKICGKTHRILTVDPQLLELLKQRYMVTEVTEVTVVTEPVNKAKINKIEEFDAHGLNQ